MCLDERERLRRRTFGAFDGSGVIPFVCIGITCPSQIGNSGRLGETVAFDMADLCLDIGKSGIVRDKDHDTVETN
jgi:hypothetical protein